MAAYPNVALGEFLRARRERLDPEELSLTSLRRRRTAGLRREEVAERAGIGVDWYVRLEQGRSASPPMATIDALARALCLDEIEHDHLRALARNAPARAFRRETVPEVLRILVSSLQEPAYVTGQRWDVLFWNAAASGQLVDFDGIAEDRRNILLFMFLDPAARRLFGARWPATARRMVAQFRKTYDHWATDGAFKSLAAQLTKESPDFATWWRAHQVGASEGGAKTLYRQADARSYVYGSFQVADSPELRLTIYSPLRPGPAASPPTA
ncbi:transcriptional regulator, XRE family [Tistlia consotensis]|uniref:Transcriptional regulator, XRE family n=1 Tax=Tistlia consotensis USBA 355 TaxID=560819 RepID=A0A1Y6B731_9PROT|nr:helix-turn-helix transcriptional regulator [Tistlia consotensis]SME88635.1 transcriptional regulator, XRE family [Tistlia consotensis USBA 355]SNR25154.1 transcriptional regulator, XRE family [Tistlia consotensis]